MLDNFLKKKICKLYQDNKEQLFTFLCTEVEELLKRLFEKFADKVQK